MRVAVHHNDPDHPNAGVFAYRFGRVQSTNDPLTGKPISGDDLMVALLDQARDEYPAPDYTVKPQRILCDGCDKPPHGASDECGATEASWHDIDEDALRARAAGDTVDVNVVTPGAEVSHDVTAEQGTETEA